MLFPGEFNLKKSSHRGFTLIEIAAVVVILSMLFAFILPSLESFSPTYRLRSLAREIGSTMQEARQESVIQGQEFGIRYDFSRSRFGLLFPAGYSQDARIGAQGKGEVLDYHYLEADLKLESILLPDQKRITSGTEDILFDPLGKEGSHIVLLSTSNGKKKIWVKFNAFTGLVTYSEKELKFEEYKEGGL